MAGFSLYTEEHGLCFIDMADGRGELVVSGRKWRFEFHEYCGPLWLKADGYTPRKCQCPTSKAVWDAFELWLKEHRSRQKKHNQLEKTKCKH